MSKSSQVSDLEFNLDQVNGKVVITKKVIVPAFQTVIAREVTKVTGHQKHVHVLVEPFPNCTSIFVPSNTSELIPGGSGVGTTFLSKMLGIAWFSGIEKEEDTVRFEQCLHSISDARKISMMSG